MRSFSVEVRGHQYQGAWVQIAGDMIEIRSDYGRCRVAIEGRQPADIARKALASMIPGPDARYWSPSRTDI